MSAIRQAKWKRDPITAKGKKFKIYQDPMSRKHFEGTAKVTIQFAEPNHEGFIYCEVEFDDEPGRKFQRAVHPDDQIFERAKQ